MSNQSNNKITVCPKCRYQNNGSAQRCRNCGSRLPTNTPDEDEASKKPTATRQVETSTQNSDAPIGINEYFKRFVRDLDK